MVFCGRIPPSSPSIRHRTGRPATLHHPGLLYRLSNRRQPNDVRASRGGAPATPRPPRRRRRGGPSSSRVARPDDEHRRPAGRRARGKERLRGAWGGRGELLRRDQGLLPSPREGDSPRRRCRSRFPPIPSDPRRLRGLSRNIADSRLMISQILSDSLKRAHYDSYLRSQRRIVQKHPRLSRHVYPSGSGSGIAVARESNVVEWLKWYRLTIDDIVTKKRVATGSGYFGRLESELYTAIHAAYYGPDVESMDVLPDCFEAEERSVYETSELLHLVSGRDLFGTVNVADSVKELSDAVREKLAPSGFRTSGVTPNISTNVDNDSMSVNPVDFHKKEMGYDGNPPSDAYKDIELRICGKVVATATRSPKCNCIDKADVEDHIHVFLVPNEVVASDLMQGNILLGTITGLSTSGEEGCCCVYDGRGVKTHIIVKHRTLMVKHMHWYQVRDKVSPCECRCSRARLPPSRYWLFEPRCYMHDTGGWYVETFGRDKKGRTIPSPRQWDGLSAPSEKRLHPAMYLVSLAYRSLDLEDARRKQWSISNFLLSQLSHIRLFGKKLINGDKGFDMRTP